MPKPLSNLPDGSRVTIDRGADRTTFTLPPTPLTIGPRILLAANIFAIALVFCVGMLFLSQYVMGSFLAPTLSHLSAYEKAALSVSYLELAIACFAACIATFAVFGVIWIPRVATETLSLSEQGYTWTRDGWWRHERVTAAWDQLQPGALVECWSNAVALQQASGKRRSIAESITEAEREWLAANVNHIQATYR